MSYFSQMTQVAFHNFTSAAVGLAAAIALARPGVGYRLNAVARAKVEIDRPYVLERSARVRDAPARSRMTGRATGRR